MLWTATAERSRVDVLVERCVADGVITAEQAEVMRG